MSRPEHSGPAECFYNETESRKYAQSSRMIQIQSVIAERALELLNLPQGKPCLLLDVGCGTGLSGTVLAEHGHTWVGTDISPDMLKVGSERMGLNDEGSLDEEACDGNGTGDLLHNDMGHGLGFRSGVFDGAISISAVQWLCYANKKEHIPRHRLTAFFRTLYSSLRRGARAVIQLYPETPQQMEMITNAAMTAGFTGGVVVDYPMSAKAKKYYLTLFANRDPNERLPQGLDDGVAAGNQAGVRFEGRARGKKRKRQNEKFGKKTKDWILGKKERQRKQGKKVRNDSKYTGRKRRPRF